MDAIDERVMQALEAFLRKHSVDATAWERKHTVDATEWFTIELEANTIHTFVLDTPKGEIEETTTGTIFPLSDPRCFEKVLKFLKAWLRP